LAAPSRRREGAAAVVADALLSLDRPAWSTTDRAAARLYVAESVASMPDSTRWGVHAVGAVVYGLASALGGRPLDRQTPETRARVTRAVLRLPVPGVAEYARLTRGLGLVGAIDAHDGR
jgi:hypothetical protein